MLFLAALIVALGLAIASDAEGHSAHGSRAVSLSEARYAPTMLARIPAGTRATFDHQCPRGTFYSEVSAYRADGSALGPQRWNRDHTRTYWRASPTRAVGFDGITFHNRTTRPVLVAGWCH